MFYLEYIHAMLWLYSDIYSVNAKVERIEWRV